MLKELHKAIRTLTPWAMQKISNEVETEVLFAEQMRSINEDHYALCQNEPIQQCLKEITEAYDKIIAIQQGRLFYTE